MAYDSTGRWVNNIPQQQPYQNQQAQAYPMYTPVDLRYARGIEEVRNTPLGPNSKMDFWDTNEQIVYVKITDAFGNATIKICDFTVREDPSSKDSSLQDIKDEIASLREEFKSLSEAWR